MLSIETICDRLDLLAEVDLILAALATLEQQWRGVPEARAPLANARQRALRTREALIAQLTAGRGSDSEPRFPETVH